MAKKKAAAGKAAAKTANEPAADKKPGGRTGRKKYTKFAPAQTVIDDDIDPRIKPLDQECQKVLAADDEIRSAKEDRREAEGKIKELLTEHELRQYTVNGIKFYIKPGEDTVAHEKAKQS